jgi:hypothetical protein
VTGAALLLDMLVIKGAVQHSWQYKVCVEELLKKELFAA